MIPKVIHYCWFGRKEHPPEVKKCIESWKKYLSDYEIIEWNEDNYDVDKHPFMKKAYEAKKWAFVSDYARVDIVNQYGGIYLDTDVEVIKNFDQFLRLNLFAGFEDEKYVNFGIGFGAEKDHFILEEILEAYDNIEFPDTEIGLGDISCPKIQTNILKKYGLICNGQTQNFKGYMIYSPEYFCPISYTSGQLKITDNTVSIHHFDMSWSAGEVKKIKQLEWKFVSLFGVKWGKPISSLVLFPRKIVRHYKDGDLLHYIKILIKNRFL